MTYRHIFFGGRRNLSEAAISGVCFKQRGSLIGVTEGIRRRALPAERTADAVRSFGLILISLPGML